MIRAVMAVATMLACAATHAQDSGFFMSGSVGKTRASAEVPAGYSIVPAGASIVPAWHSVDGANTTWALGGGYRFNRYFGIEGGYRDFSKQALQGDLILNDIVLHTTWSGADIPLNFGTVEFSGRHTADMTALTLGGVVAYPLTESIELTARGGWFRWRTEWSHIGKTAWTDGVTTGSETFLQSGTSTGTQPYFGAGVSYSVFKNTAISLNWTRFKSASIITDDADALDLGLTYRF